MTEVDKKGVEQVEVLNYVVAAEEVRSNIRLREIFSIVLLSIFGLSILFTYALIFFWGYGTIHLDKAFAHWLGGATIGQTATLLVSIVGYLFPRQQPRARKKHDATRKAR